MNAMHSYAEAAKAPWEAAAKRHLDELLRVSGENGEMRYILSILKSHIEEGSSIKDLPNDVKQCLELAAKYPLPPLVDIPMPCTFPIVPL